MKVTKRYTGDSRSRSLEIAEGECRGKSSRIGDGGGGRRDGGWAGGGVGGRREAVVTMQSSEAVGSRR